MASRRLGLVVLLVAAGAQAQTARPTVVTYPLDLDPNPALTRVEPALREAYQDALQDKAGVLTPSKAEIEEAYAATRRQDCRESNDCLAQLATKAATLYAVYGALEYSAKRQLVLHGRVVRDDGKLMATARAEASVEGNVVDALRGLAPQFFEQLGLRALAPFKEAGVAAASGPGAVVVAAPPADGAPLRLAGMVLTGVGAAAAVAGGVVFASAGTIRTQGSNVLVEDAPKVAGVQAAQGAGVALLVAGAGTAALGGVLWMLAPKAPRVALIPTAGGAFVHVGGEFP